MTTEFGANLRRPPGILPAVGIIIGVGLILRLTVGMSGMEGLLAVLQGFSPVVAIESVVPYMAAGFWLGRGHGRMRDVVVATAILVGFAFGSAMLQLRHADALALFARLMLPFVPYLLASFLAGPAGFWLAGRVTARRTGTVV